MLRWNLAEEYAQRFHLPEKAPHEAEWQFRERIARSLEEMEERLGGLADGAVKDSLRARYLELYDQLADQMAK